MVSASTNPEGGTLGPYRLARRLSVGGMAEVFEAFDTRDGTRWAMKVPLPSASREPAYVEALEHEAALAVRLDHPNLVRGRELVRDAARIGFVMELVDGLPLDRLFEASLDTRPGGAVALVAVEALLEALATAHEATDAQGAPLHVVHRDVKPANVFVSRRGEVKLLDFGIARSAVQSARTRTGTIKGTLRYLTPEQATGSTLDARTDLYAVALLAYEWIVGAPYLDAATDLELLRLAEDPPEKPFPSTLPEAARRQLGRCLARFPEDRPSRARAVAQALGLDAVARAEATQALAAWVAALSPEAPLDATLDAFGRASTTPDAEVRSATDAAPLPAADAAPVSASSTRPTARTIGLTAAVALAATFALVMALRSDPVGVVGTVAPPHGGSLAGRGPAERPGAAAASTQPSTPPPPASPSSSATPVTATPSAGLTPAAPSPRSTGSGSGRDVPPARLGAPTAAEGPPVAAGETSRAATAPTGAAAPSAAPPSASPEPDGSGGTSPEARPESAPAAPAEPTRDSVRRRLAIADAAMRDARARGEDVRALERDARTALERYAEGDYAGADRALTALLRMLPR